MQDQHDYLLNDSTIKNNEKRITIVVWMTLITMIAEIFFGYLTKSMALLADGWHMGSHVGALGISLIAYKLARKSKMKSALSFGTGKFIPLGGYTSSLMLAFVAVFMIVESIERFLSPLKISFDMAIIVATIGLIINLLSAIILWDKHHENSAHYDTHTHDHNHHGALMHVIADAFTSILAIAALIFGKYFNLYWPDPLIGIVGGLVILKWAFGLAKSTAWELLDGHAKIISRQKVEDLLKSIEGAELLDLHIWRIAPNAHACEVVIRNSSLLGSDFYRSKISEIIDLEHIVIEERLI